MFTWVAHGFKGSCWGFYFLRHRVFKGVQWDNFKEEGRPRSKELHMPFQVLLGLVVFKKDKKKLSMEFFYCSMRRGWPLEDLNLWPSRCQRDALANWAKRSLFGSLARFRFSSQSEKHSVHWRGETENHHVFYQQNDPRNFFFFGIGNWPD